jgi:hypothetical protein
MMCFRQKVYDGVSPAKNSHYCKIKFKKKKKKKNNNTDGGAYIFISYNVLGVHLG